MNEKILIVEDNPIHMKLMEMILRAKNYTLLKATDGEEALDMAVKNVRYAKSLTEHVEFSAEDAVRTDVDYLCQVIEAVIDAGATSINVPDTVGYSIPDEFGSIIKTITRS